MTPPGGTSAVGAAVSWIQSTLLGSAETAIAVVAVAFIGFLMLTGRTDIRRAAQVVLGCFIIFGATSIAAGIQAAAAQVGAGDGLAQEAALPEAYSAPSAPSYPQVPPKAYDPYAGAALTPLQ